MTQASAPGKLLWSGEYAVLHGAPALVSAVGCRARVTICPGSNRFRSSEAGSVPVAFSRAQKAFRWVCEETLAERLALARTLLERLDQDGVDIEADTAAFRHGDAKLGLGSSAALTVAWVAAARAEDDPGRIAREAADIHRAFQHGRGSGVDIAAASHGGLLAFRQDAAPVALRWPAGVGRLVLWTGRSADTRAYLQRLSAWRERDAAGYAHRMDRLKRLAQAAVDAAAADRGSNFATGLGAYGEAMDDLGRAAGLAIVSPVHQRLAAMAAGVGVVYKPSGAGGGDCGVAVAEDPAGLVEFAARAPTAGARVLELALDVPGVRLEADPES